MGRLVMSYDPPSAAYAHLTFGLQIRRHDAELLMMDSMSRFSSRPRKLTARLAFGRGHLGTKGDSGAAIFL